MALACPSCAALVHRERLNQLAGLATAAAESGDNAAARTYWQEAQALLPPTSEQHRAIGERIASLAPEVPSSTPVLPSTSSQTSWWGKGLAGAAIVGELLQSKLKFLVLGLTKMSTFVSMFGFIAVYWGIHGWPLAVGIAGSIYIHEMGHVAMLRKLGIQAGAPLFIPGVGALVMLKERVTDPITDALIGLAGPVYGLGAAVAAWLVYQVTGTPIWLAIAELTGFLNLFNLIPIWQLDGARGFHALSRNQRWMVVGAIGLALWITGVKVLWLVGIVAVYRSVTGAQGPGHRQTLMTFAGLVIALAWFARAVA
jgi:Zn-dependent protease